MNIINEIDLIELIKNFVVQNNIRDIVKIEITKEQEVQLVSTWEKH